jgi:transposase
MSQQRTYFPPTTPQQRKLLFETWEATGSVTAACQKAHVGLGTFYYWKPRFDTEGYVGLESYAMKGPEKGFGRTAEEVEKKVIELRGLHADWGKQRIAAEVAKANNWVPLVSPNTVRRILEGAGLWKPEEMRRKKAPLKP